jgi:hypothetical protein
MVSGDTTFIKSDSSNLALYIGGGGELTDVSRTKSLI